LGNILVFTALNAEAKDFPDFAEGFSGAGVQTYWPLVVCSKTKQSEPTSVWQTIT
jgi:hypothetical protein